MPGEYGTYIVILLVVGLISGWLAGLVTRGSGFGLAGNVIIATAGAFAASYIGRDFSNYLGLAGIVIIGFCGSFLILWLIAGLRR